MAEITGRLAELHAQKDVAVGALVERLAPLEARLAEVEGGVARVLPLAEDDPRPALAALRARLESLDHAQEAVAVGLEALRAGLARTAEEEAGAEGRAVGAAAGTAAGTAAALAEVVEGMTRLFAQKDAGLAALLARLAPLEERLAAVEARPRDPAVAEAVAGALGEAAGAAAEAEAARAEARAVAGQLALVQAAAEASAERAALFADRISGLEASLPRLSAAEVRAMAAAAPEPGAETGAPAPGRRPGSGVRSGARGAARPAAGGLAPPEVSPGGGRAGPSCPPTAVGRLPGARRGLAAMRGSIMARRRMPASPADSVRTTSHGAGAEGRHPRTGQFPS